MSKGVEQMPELCRFYNIVIKMLFSDNGQHNKPHFHVYYSEYEASVGIDGELLAGKYACKTVKACSGILGNSLRRSLQGME